MSSPMKAFVNDWCEIKPDSDVPVYILWQAHCRWASENGNSEYAKRKFIVEIKGACEGLRCVRKRVNLSKLYNEYSWDRADKSSKDNRITVFSGIDLHKDFKKKWDKTDSGTGSGTVYPF